MKRCAILPALLLALVAVPAFAAGTFVDDGAAMFSPQTVAQLETQLSNFNAQTGKSVNVVTVASLDGATPAQAAQNAYAQHNVNGVLIFIAKAERKDYILPDAAGLRAGWFTTDVTSSIRTAMESQFKDGDFNGGITTAVNGALNVYRSHLTTLPSTQTQSQVTYGAPQPYRNGYTPGVHVNMFWLLIMVFVGFMILRSIIRAASSQRTSVGSGVPPPGPGAGGFGPGYYGGGGGSFWSGLLGGLGGAWLGNELFRGGGGYGGGYMDPNAGGWGGGAPGGAPDAGGWANDPGQAGIGGGSGGDFGGGGFGGDGGGGWGGDFGGGGGGDFGGGGSGGGW